MRIATRLRLWWMNWKFWRASLGRPRWEEVPMVWYMMIGHTGEQGRRLSFELPTVAEPRIITGLCVQPQSLRRADDFLSVRVGTQIIMQISADLGMVTFYLPFLVQKEELISYDLEVVEQEPVTYRVALLGKTQRQIEPEHWYSPFRRLVKRVKLAWWIRMRRLKSKTS